MTKIKYFSKFWGNLAIWKRSTGLIHSFNYHGSYRSLDCFKERCSVKVQIHFDYIC